MDERQLQHEIRHTWSASDRFVPRAFVQPVTRFMETEAAGAVVMLVAAIVALVWANSPWHESYTDLWATTLDIELGDLAHIDLTLGGWVNDALMAVFFLLVGLEIKREIVHGELRDPRKVALPAIAALGGMIVPAAIYTAFNAGGPGADGWGIPMATDIAFAVAVVTLVGDRVPSAAKVFLLTLAIADDIGAIVVIAIFYTDDLALGWLAVALTALAAMEVCKRADIRALPVYLSLGAACWFALHESGVHATLAGVATGLLTPAWSFHDPRRFAYDARRLIDASAPTDDDGVLTEHEYDINQSRLEELGRLVRETLSPLERLELALNPWVSYLIVPLFALANAGVRIVDSDLGELATEPVVLGVAFGLVVGKTVGVFGATMIAARTGVGRLPDEVTTRHVAGLAVTAGVGFTVALFVASLAFTDPVLTSESKVGILAGSLVAGIAGYLLLRSNEPVGRLGPRPDTPPGGTAAPDVERSIA